MMHLKHLRLKPLLMTSLVLLISSCSIGIKEKNTIIYVSLTKPIANQKSLIRIATNKKIKVTVNGKLAKKDVGGFYILSKRDVDLLIRNAK